MIGWGERTKTDRNGSERWIRRGARGKALANSPFFARSLSVLLVFPVLPELGRQSVPGRAEGMGAHVKDWLGNWEYWEFWDYWELWEFFAPGCAKNSSPLLSVFHR